MKRFFQPFVITIIVFFSFGLLRAQVKDAVFIGVGNTKGGLSFTYKLQVTDSNGQLTGYSISDIKGPDETKSNVTGTINYDKKQCTFRETGVVYTKSPSVKNNTSYLCYIHAQLKISRKKKTTILKGNFSAYKSDHTTECASGQLILMNAEDVLNKMLEKNEKKDSLIKRALTAAPDTTEMRNESYTYENTPSIPDSKVSKILPGGHIELQYSHPNIEIEVWDAKTIDGDVVTIKHNALTILENYKLTAGHKRMSIAPGNSHCDTITVIAINEGAEPMNTARLKITSGGDSYYVDASTTMDKPVIIFLKRRN